MNSPINLNILENTIGKKCRTFSNYFTVTINLHLSDTGNAYSNFSMFENQQRFYLHSRNIRGVLVVHKSLFSPYIYIYIYELTRSDNMLRLNQTLSALLTASKSCPDMYRIEIENLDVLCWNLIYTRPWEDKNSAHYLLLKFVMGVPRRRCSIDCVARLHELFFTSSCDQAKSTS